MKAQPVTLEALVDDLISRIDRLDPAAAPRPRIGVDGPATAFGDDLAARLVAALHDRGTFALHVPADGFLRARSLRLERGRTNPDAFYEDWLDLRALTREVLAPAGPGGTGRVLPSLRDPVTDRATRAGYVEIPDGGAVVVSGTLLLGAGLDFDLAVHLTQSDAALTRRTPPDQQWQLPAYTRYRDEVMPEYLADLVVRADDPRHPALVVDD
ncbi:uridine kinase [Dactylosporangium fulvum]|uniref:Uridine kinase n=1 Tax=Dactylosporangium fulvum TaxID=53359 RepID=A0ABY5VMW0_9ACTN|nr:uridine kinase [Dactylosporangium fulvum]UWP78440.1 uridine kinase [Dactylosporangium fulvum]